MTIITICIKLFHNIMHAHAQNLFSHTTSSSKSWFIQIRDMCLQYILPHPTKLLQSSLTKDQYKKLVYFWEIKLRKEVSELSSLTYFSPAFMLLSRLHPIWSTAGSSPANISMTTVQCRMLSRRYRTQLLSRHWSTKYPSRNTTRERCLP